MNITTSNIYLNERGCFDTILVPMDHDKAFSLSQQFTKNYDFIAVATTRRKFVVGMCVVSVEWTFVIKVLQVTMVTKVSIGTLVILATKVKVIILKSPVAVNCTQVYMYNVWYFCRILTENGVCR
jgi:hypothetical protein